MKKIIALALALVMALSMASVAFADLGASVVPSATAQNENLFPGEKYYVDFNDAPEAYVTTGTDHVTDGTKVSVKWTKGGALVDEVKLDKKAADGAANLYIKLNENYTITDNKDLVGTITLKNGANSVDVPFAAKVANNTVTVYGEKKKADAEDAPQVPVPADNTLYICDEDYAGYVAFGTKANLLSVTMKMEAKEKAFMAQTENDKDIMDALEEKYPDADIEAYTFGGQPSFKNAAEFKLQADYADQYKIYAYEGGKLTAVDADWDSIEGVYTWTTKAPRTYVISDVELVAAAEEAEEGTKNPDTGANDVVGVAAALAVVSLVAAGAVSLKK